MDFRAARAILAYASLFGCVLFGISALASYRKSDPDHAKRELEALQLTPVKLEEKGWRVFSPKTFKCERRSIATYFTARAANGVLVSGIVCQQGVRVLPSPQP